MWTEPRQVPSGRGSGWRRLADPSTVSLAARTNPRFGFRELARGLLLLPPRDNLRPRKDVLGLLVVSTVVLVLVLQGSSGGVVAALEAPATVSDLVYVSPGKMDSSSTSSPLLLLSIRGPKMEVELDARVRDRAEPLLTRNDRARTKDCRGEEVMTMEALAVDSLLFRLLWLLLVEKGLHGCACNGCAGGALVSMRTSSVENKEQSSVSDSDSPSCSSSLPPNKRSSRYLSLSAVSQLPRCGASLNSPHSLSRSDSSPFVLSSRYFCFMALPCILCRISCRWAKLIILIMVKIQCLLFPRNKLEKNEESTTTTQQRRPQELFFFVPVVVLI